MLMVLPLAIIFTKPSLKLVYLFFSDLKSIDSVTRLHFLQLETMPVFFLQLPYEVTEAQCCSYLVFMQAVIRDTVLADGVKKPLRRLISTLLLAT